MGRKATVTITCDRCGDVMNNGKTWRLQNGRISRITHDVSEWGRVDEFLLCDGCRRSFMGWLKMRDARLGQGE